MKKSRRSKLVSIVIVNYNGKGVTLDLLKSLKKTSYPNYEIIVSDNASTDGSIQAIRKCFPYVEIVKNKKNLGYPGALNTGLKKSKGDYIVTLNNDMIVYQGGWLSELVKVAETDKKIGVVRIMDMQSADPELIEANVYLFSKMNSVSRAILKLFGGTFLKFGMMGKGKKDVGLFPRVVDVEWAGTCLIKRGVFDKIGIFDRKFFLYYDDMDFCYRAKKSGYRVVLATKAKLIHKHGATIKKQKSFAVYHFYRSRLRYMLKNYGFERFFIAGFNLLYYVGLITIYALAGRPDFSRAIRDAAVWNIKNWREYI